MKKIILIALATPLLFAACKKDTSCCETDLQKMLIQQRSSLPSAIQVLDMLEQPTDGYIWLKSYIGPAHQRPATYCSGFINGPWDMNFTGSTLRFGGISTTLPPDKVQYLDFIDTDYQHENIYGTTQNVRITLQDSEEQSVLNADFYVPKHIDITNYTFQPNQIPAYGPNSTIEWSADAANPYGIGIVVLYNSLDPDNSGYTGSRVSNLIHTEDDGTYTFGASDFADIPAGAHISIAIGRGNYQIAPLGSGGKKLGIYNYSVKSVPARFQN